MEAVERVAVAVRGGGSSRGEADGKVEEVSGGGTCGEVGGPHAVAQFRAQSLEVEQLVEGEEADEVRGEGAATDDVVPGVAVEVAAAARARGLSFDGGGVVLGEGG